MTEEQRRMLAAMVKKHPDMRVKTLMGKIETQIKVTQLRNEIGCRPERAEAQKEMLSGLEWM
ncbi:hypothetical protein MUO32_26300 [Shinella sp. CPCC 101442]|uniref:hypothetical protein n=1 Tax=Shinella sp. CPCC 101442 TaxID=2932265 RepID=UPI0021527D26|nr:hypothetical protein [Shinella sp. CPCC 101442]MCR6502543.1 hypothetical protein [Shinella sp. CPCC 101442]